MNTRRSFLGQTAAALMVPPAGQAAAVRASTFIDLLRQPDRVTAYGSLTEPIGLLRSGERWQGSSIELECRIEQAAQSFTVSAPGTSLSFIHVRWNAAPTRDLLVLGDAWERSYGDLGWRSIIPERVMPWYFATHDGVACHGYGVKTGAGSLCFWQLDEAGVSLWMNVMNGGMGVQLGERRLHAATVVARRGHPGEDPMTAVRAFCETMCSQPALPFEPIYGANDWYYAYGKNTAARILEDTEFIVDLSPAGATRPFSVVDDGWEDRPKAFPDMQRLAKEIAKLEAQPGIWIRPLLAPASAAPNVLLDDKRFGERQSRAKELAYDPTIGEAREKIQAKVKEAVSWGYELVKHDFSTYDLLGQWGFEMGPRPTLAGWSLHDRSRTNAEVFLDLYQLIRSAAGPHTSLLGCNTIGHLGQGIFNIQRTGDDTSGREWERTRRMGVNTLAFRLPQHGTFFIQDADCAGLSRAVSWEKNRQWLELLALSGTALFISPGEGSREAEQKQAIREAFQIAASGGRGARPLYWLKESAPDEWTVRGAAHLTVYTWSSPDGANPFAS